MIDATIEGANEKYKSARLFHKQEENGIVHTWMSAAALIVPQLKYITNFKKCKSLHLLNKTMMIAILRVGVNAKLNGKVR